VVKSLTPEWSESEADSVQMSSQASGRPVCLELGTRCCDDLTENELGSRCCVDLIENQSLSPEEVLQNPTSQSLVLVPKP
jgi:hypothetical protein